MGFSEIVTYSFISPKYYDKIRLAGGQPAAQIAWSSHNPLGEDTSVMRTTTLPSMLEVLSRNYNNRNKAAALYEIGQRLPAPSRDSELPDERSLRHDRRLRRGTRLLHPQGRSSKRCSTAAGIEGRNITAVSDDPTYHPGRCAVHHRERPRARHASARCTRQSVEELPDRRARLCRLASTAGGAV